MEGTTEASKTLISDNTALLGLIVALIAYIGGVRLFLQGERAKEKLHQLSTREEVRGLAARRLKHINQALLLLIPADLLLIVAGLALFAGTYWGQGFTVGDWRDHSWGWASVPCFLVAVGYLVVLHVVSWTREKSAWDESEGKELSVYAVVFFSVPAGVLVLYLLLWG